MKIALLDPYGALSHRRWAEGYAARSAHEVRCWLLPGRHWKWRMHGGGLTLAQQVRASGFRPDLLLVSGMADLALVLAALRRELPQVPVALYLHENQLTYPWSDDDPCPIAGRDQHYGFIQWSSALLADAVLFNSAYHRDAFLAALPDFLRRFPPPRDLDSIAAIAGKSRVLFPGIDLAALDGPRPPRGKTPLVLWNHRWEYDKNPQLFFEALLTLADEGVPFRLAVLGESFARTPPIFTTARQRLADRIVHWGFAADRAAYAAWLRAADLLPVTAHHEFYGISTIEALSCGCRPLLPERLAYPEHLPPELRAAALYADDADFLPRLRQLLTDFTPWDPAPLQAHVARYDWGVLTPHYDALFAALAETGATAGKLKG